MSESETKPITDLQFYGKATHLLGEASALVAGCNGIVKAGNVAETIGASELAFMADSRLCEVEVLLEKWWRAKQSTDREGRGHHE